MPFSYFLSLTDLFFPSCSVLQDGISQCHFSAAVSSRLGCDVRSVGCVPACSNPSGIVSSSRLFILGSDLFLQGLTVRAVRLALGVHQISSSKFLGPPRFLSTVYLGGYAEFRLPYHLEEVILFPVTVSLFSGRSFGLLLARPQDHRFVALQKIIQELVFSGSALPFLWQKFFGLKLK